MGYDPNFPLVVCPTCAAADFTPLAPPPLPAVRCRRCGLGIELCVSDDPTGGYAAAAYDAKRNAGNGSNRWARFHHDCAVATARLAQLAEPLASVPAPARVWLDVGANNGATLVTARRNRWVPVGVEADPDCCRDLTALHGFAVEEYGRWVAGYGPTAAGVVSLFDVIEHLIDPPAAVIAAGATLAPGGVLIIEVPDLDAAESFVAWKHRRITTDGRFVEHQFHFCESALAQMVDRYAPWLAAEAVNRPVTGRLQCVWRAGGPVRADAVTAAADFIAGRLLALPAGDRQVALDGLKQTNPELAAAVVDRIAAAQASAAT